MIGTHCILLTELEQKVALGKEEAKNVRIDTMLESEQQSEEGESNDENEDCHLNGENKEGNDGVPTIEMTVALGDFDSNPVVSLLEEDKHVVRQLQPEGNGDASNGILLDGTNKDMMNDPKAADAPPLLSAISVTRKKPFIQEISKS